MFVDLYGQGYSPPMSNRFDQSAAFYHRQFQEPVSYEQFITLASAFRDAIAAKYPGDIETSVAGGEIARVEETENGNVRTVAKVTFGAFGMENMPETVWKNQAISRVVFRPAADDQVLGALFFDMDDPLQLVFILCPGDPDIQRQISPQWGP